MEKILVTGSRGLVGSRFVELSRSDHQLLTPGSSLFDLKNIDTIDHFLREYQPDWVINFAAFTDVDAAEQGIHDPSSPAWKINVGGVQNLTNAFISEKIIHISTDMVFSGDLLQPGPFNENDTTQTDASQLTWYGYTKSQAEKIILERGGTILRIIYPVRAVFTPKPDFLRGALHRYQSGTLRPLFTDQQISIAFIDEMSCVLNEIIKQDMRGIFHASSDTTTPYDLVKFSLEQLGIVPDLETALIDDFLETQPNPYRYPRYGGLKTAMTEKKLGIRFSTWQGVVEKMIAQGLSLT